MTAPSEAVATVDTSVAAGRFAVEVDTMSVWYGKSSAVRDFSMHVPHGSVYGLLGPSGAGKSTAIRVLATLQQPDTGTVLIDGIDTRVDPAAARERIGYLPDFSGVYEGLTVGEYLDFYGAIYAVPPRRRRQMTDELLELIGLTDRRDRSVKTLSRGMKQKLGLARCLVHDPQILLLDEPASGMDLQSRRDLRDMLRELARLHKTIVISSHMLAELAEVCTHLGVMRTGELITEGSVDEITGVVAPNPRVRVDLLRPDDVATAQEILEGFPACSDVETVNASTMVARFEGTRQDLAAILRELSAGGIQVTELRVERPTLEDVFLRVIDIGAQG